MLIVPDEEEVPGPSVNQLAGEENIAVRIKLERDARGWSTNAVSDRLNAAGYEPVRAVLPATVYPQQPGLVLG